MCSGVRICNTYQTFASQNFGRLTSSNMTKECLIETVAKKTGCSKSAAADYLNTILDEIGNALKKGEKVTLTGFGTFSVSRRKARTGRNPATGATIKIPAKTVPKFKAGKVLKAAVK